MAVSQRTTQKQCSVCRVRKPGAEFGRHTKRPDGLSSACKPCLAESRKIKGCRVMPSDPIGAGEWDWAFVLFRRLSFAPGYAVDSSGSLWTCRRGYGKNGQTFFPFWRQVKCRLNPFGYRVANLHTTPGSPAKHCMVHRLVLEAFCGPCPAGMQCRHLDGRCTNNDVRNLAWGTPAENYGDRVRHGTNATGSRYSRAKLKEADIPVIVEMIQGGASKASIGRLYGVSSVVICAIGTGRLWKHVNPIQFQPRPKEGGER